MFWVDRIANDIIEKYPHREKIIIRDEKTLSGQVHVGSVRGVMIHGVIAEALNLKGKPAEFIYEFNDADPMDGMPGYLDPKIYNQHMGKPLRNIPSPGEREYQGKSASNMAEYYGLEFLEVIHKLGFQPTITWAYQLYHEGFYDEWIRKVLQFPEEIKAIYKDISGSEKAADWMPLQVVCEKCGKIGPTTVTSFDGELASYRCEPNKVDWAEGCGHEGKIAPWKGNGKIPWKVEWPVKWASYKVDVEGAGKDHCAASGSHDVGEAIMEKVLKAKTPYNIPYEFFLIEGAKMSSSKGNASSAKAITDLLPPQVFRFLMLMKDPNQPIEFSPNGDTIPRLFDRYDEAARHYFSDEADKTHADLDRLFFYSQLDLENIEERFLPRFSKLVFWHQMPHVNIEEMVEKEKGAPLTELDKAELKERLFYVNLWVSGHAPERYIYKVLEETPDSARELQPEQKQLLAQIVEVLEGANSAANDASKTLSGEAIHGEIHALVKASPLKPKEAFPSIYQALMGKNHGPQVGWFIDALDSQFVINRFKEVATSSVPEKEIIPPFESSILHIKGDVIDKFPWVKAASVEMTGLKIGKNSEILTKKIEEVLAQHEWMERKSAPELEAYKQMFRDFGTNPNKRKPSPCMLVGRLAKGKDFPRINDLVDAYNYIVIKHLISAGAFNKDPLMTPENVLPITLRFAHKGERFTGINDKERVLDEGELCYFDANQICLARDFNHLDADHLKITEEVSNIYLNFDAGPHTTNEAFQAAVEELTQLVLEVCGGSVGEKVMRLA
jgi:lysyl-tRNA synthetase class 1